MALTVLLEIRITPESVDATAPALLRDTLAGTRAFAGCQGVEVLVDAADETHIVIVEHWESVEADAAYRVWRAGDGKVDLTPILAGAPTLTTFHTADDI
jgi:quinol monooxygenase YgiN